MRIELFAHEIQEDILKRQPLIAYSENERNLPSPVDRHIFTAIDNARFEKLFAQHGGTIISHEALRRQKTPLPILEYLRTLTDAILEPEEIDLLGDFRKQYMVQICTALSSVYYKQLRWRLFLRDYSDLQEPDIEDDLPAALAATGKLTKLLELVADNPDRLRQSCSCLSSPLEAAAACDQVEVVKAIITTFSASDRETHKLSRPANGAGLIAAMRKGARLSGNVLLDECILTSRVKNSSWLHLTKEVARHADNGFMKRLLEMNKDNDGKIAGLKKYEAEYVLQEGSCSVLRAIIQDGYLDPNGTVGDSTPLTLAIRHHRYDLARVLVQHGAYVDSIPNTGEPVTALWHAAKTGYRGYGDNVLPGVKFLLKNGADPDFGEDWRSPLQAVKMLWPDVGYLLQQAKDNGRDVALDPETWRKYQDRSAGEVRIVMD
jgi:hypothetical protein